MNWELENSAEILITSSLVSILNLLKFKGLVGIFREREEDAEQIEQKLLNGITYLELAG